MSCDAGELKHSCVYQGSIRHRRFTPVSNVFRYSMFMWYIDLDELDALSSRFWFLRQKKPGIVSYCREDYFGDPENDLKGEVVREVSDFFKASRQAPPEIVSVRMLSHLRYFNIIFNPVVFYYCFDASNKLVAVLAEITNTPWGERHAYVLPFIDGATQQQGFVSPSGHKMLCKSKRQEVVQFEFEKAFHVSPFNPMRMNYQWVFKRPGMGLSVHMENTMCNVNKYESRHFDATLGMKSRPLADLPQILLKQPVMTLKVVAGIYWQALKLWVKKSPFYDHPKSVKASASEQV